MWVYLYDCGHVYTFSSATWDEMCHIRLSLRNFIPYGPKSSDRERISVEKAKKINTFNKLSAEKKDEEQKNNKMAKL